MAVPPPLDEEQMKAERRHDVLLLLQHLARHEETTITLILDCLYDMGAANLINQKVKVRPLNRATKAIARFSKPAFRIYALNWFQTNCPELIANWLYSKVEFKPLPLSQPPPLSALSDPAIGASAPAVDAQVWQPSPEAALLSVEVRQLRQQVKLLTGTLAVAIVAWGATMLWMGSDSPMEVLRLIRSAPSTGVEWQPQSPDACPGAANFES